MSGEWRSLSTTRLLQTPSRQSPGPAPEGAALSVIVPCRTTRTRGHAASRHEVTIAPDWRFECPHDLDSERLAVALGGYCSCLNLADAGIPALRAWVMLALRLTPVDVRPRSGGGGWRVGSPAPCCRGRRFESVAEAAGHVRGVAHLAATFGAESDVLAALAAAAGQALGHHMGHASTADESRRAAACCRAGHRDVRYLWDAGLSPQAVIRIHARVGVETPLPRRVYLGVRVRRVDVDWLASTLAAVTGPAKTVAGDGGDRFAGLREPGVGRLGRGGAPGPEEEPLASWLAWSAAAWDRAHPAARGQWLALGVSRSRTLEMGEAGIDPRELSRHAADLGVSPDSAALRSDASAGG